MTRVRTRRRRFGSEAGYTMVEMLIATVIMVVVTGAMFDLLNPASGMFNSQPEVSDMQQRMRVGIDSMQKDLVMAGAGTYVGESAGALYNFFAPVLPRRSGDVNPDPPGTFRTDAITITYVPTTPSQTTIRDDMPNTSAQLKVNAQSNCPPNKHDALCGFKEGMRVMIFDPNGYWDTITITSVQDEALHLGHDGNLSTSYQAGAYITQVATHTYYLKQDSAAKTYQLMHYDGVNTDIPVVDDVVKLQFEYFGDPEPPRLLPGKCLAAGCPGPFTTYGPKPPVLGIKPKGSLWPAGENCAFAVQNGAHIPRLTALNGGGIGLVKLTAAMLTDGPWCPDPDSDQRYDADLLRVRRIRATVRTQVSKPWMRGPAGALFTYAGTAKAADKQIPDQEIRFDVTPRNMNLGR